MTVIAPLDLNVQERRVIMDAACKRLNLNPLDINEILFVPPNICPPETDILRLPTADIIEIPLKRVVILAFSVFRTVKFGYHDKYLYITEFKLLSDGSNDRRGAVVSGETR